MKHYVKVETGDNTYKIITTDGVEYYMVGSKDSNNINITVGVIEYEIYTSSRGTCELVVHTIRANSRLLYRNAIKDYNAIFAILDGFSMDIALLMKRFTKIFGDTPNPIRIVDQHVVFVDEDED